jgi:hypothetical protein
MSKKNPSSAGGGTGGGSGPQGERRTLLCPEWEALLVDALDGKLAAGDAAAFEAHRETCPACAQLLEDAKRGSEWLHFLETEPEVPAGLIGRILAQTSGATDVLPVPVPGLGPSAGMPGMPVLATAGGGWTAGWLPMMEQRAAQSRWMMTAAMAFFSIAFTLNLTGVKLTGIRLADLKPTTIASSLTRQFYVADAHVMRYYDNLTFFYELESRVREMRRDAEPAATTTPAKNGNPAQNGNKNSDDKAPANKRSGGNAQRLPVPEPAPEPRAEPVMAKYQEKKPEPQAQLDVLSCGIRKELNNDAGTMRAERSLA